jgi:LmbE family N-acetylglucosaminyl deacetylase
LAVAVLSSRGLPRRSDIGGCEEALEKVRTSHWVQLHTRRQDVGTRLSVAELGTVLGVWAHPDDEAYLSAGLMAAARDAGQRVVVATATYGEQGTPDPQRWPAQRLAALRRYELAASLAVVAVHEHRWLGYTDGGCAAVEPQAGASVVGRLIDEVRPDTIVTFGPDGMTGHPDHQTISAWVSQAWQASGRSARLLHATRTRHWHAEWRASPRSPHVGKGPITRDD